MGSSLVPQGDSDGGLPAVQMIRETRDSLKTLPERLLSTLGQGKTLRDVADLVGVLPDRLAEALSRKGGGGGQSQPGSARGASGGWDKILSGFGNIFPEVGRVVGMVKSISQILEGFGDLAGNRPKPPRPPAQVIRPRRAGPKRRWADVRPVEPVPHARRAARKLPPKVVHALPPPPPPLALPPPGPPKGPPPDDLEKRYGFPPGYRPRPSAPASAVGRGPNPFEIDQPETGDVRVGGSGARRPGASLADTLAPPAPIPHAGAGADRDDAKALAEAAKELAEAVRDLKADRGEGSPAAAPASPPHGDGPRRGPGAASYDRFFGRAAGQAAPNAGGGPGAPLGPRGAASAVPMMRSLGAAARPWEAQLLRTLAALA